MSEKSASGLTERIRMVGRQDELERLRRCLHARGERHILYYWAGGGLGKTRLLEELQRMVEKAGPGYHSTGIIDLYHTDTHSTSDVERAIVEGLDREQNYFAEYRQQRKRYELLRERGTDPGVLERRREELGQLFIQGCREMALDARKLVICFDTVELLQYESSIVEEMAGLDTVDTRIKPWLLSKLAQLANVLIVFAGRPKLPATDEQTTPHARLIADLEQAFGADLAVVELRPFTLEETRLFIEALTGETGIIPAQNLPIVHRLMGGQPIFLHLVVDLLQVLSPEPRVVLEMFDQYDDLVDAPEGDERLEKARHQIEGEILDNIFNKAGELGGYLSRIALMPKGVDAEILQKTLGLPGGRTEQLLEELSPLSFVKRFKALPGAERLHAGRTFLHDEMYRLLTSDVIRNMRINEYQVAHAMVSNYYDEQISQLEQEITQLSPRERIAPRERLQKLQVERLYYLLARDPRRGYEEYKRLSDQANRRRWVGFGMRLLDELLRFYNIHERRKQFEAVGISYEQIIRESTQMWVERFYWWGQLERLARFADHILKKPSTLYLRSEDTAIQGNICARLTDAKAMLYGYDSTVVEKAQEILGRLPPLPECTSEQALAHARLCASIGYQFDLGGLLDQTAIWSVKARAAYHKSRRCPDELAILLHSLAFAYAKQGRMALARPLAHEALRINEEMGNEYSTGLTLSTLSKIARMRGNYPQAVAYGEEAMELFHELEDAHGTVLAYLGIVQARRQMAKHEIEKGRKLKLEDAHRTLEDACRSLDRAMEVAKEADLGGNIPVLHAEQGRVYRDLGHIVRRLEGSEEGLVYYRQSERQLRQALETTGWGKVDRANTLQDLAEVFFFSGDREVAQERLREVEELIGPEHQIIPGEHVPEEELPHEYFAPLGKVEMTRGQMAFAQGQLEKGLRHFVLAYAYFVRFSPEAVEKDTLVEYLYNHLRGASIERQQDVLESVQAWVEQYNLGVDVGSFLETLENLLGT